MGSSGALRAPHAERALIGCALLSPQAAEAVLDGTTDEDYCDPRAAWAWLEIRAAVAAGVEVDEVVLARRLDAGEAASSFGGSSFAWLSECVAQAPIGEAVGAYVREVRDSATRRRLAALAVDMGEMLRSSPESPAKIADEIAMRLSSAAGTSGGPAALELDGLIADELRRMDAARSGADASCVPTGLEALDGLLGGGLHRGNLVVAAGRPGMGKSALGVGVAISAAVAGVRTLICSLEMSASEITQRILSTRSGVDGEAIRRGAVSLPPNAPRMARALAELAKAPIGICDRGALTMLELRSIARRYRAQHGGLGLLVVDYLQLLRGEGESREQAVADVARGLKALAKELAVPVLALAQLNRGVEARAEKIPVLSDLRESGAIEQDADVVLLLYRAGYYDQTADQGAAQVIVAKNRHGAAGTAEVGWTPRTASFSPATSTPRQNRGTW